MVDFDPTRDHEQAGRRPAIVFSVDHYNQLGSGLVAVIPLTSKDHRLSWHERIPPEASGLPRASWALIDHLRFVSLDRIVESQPRGQIPAAFIERIRRRLFDLLGI
jgi:mRNA interferase MazF